ncbi:regulatory protein RecX [Pseudolysinimonas sp.]|uniref:regulatory protein RecX n=1 Tax=Pseudolysinimonas sp. TaxID=2680009 RepID=UPI003F7FD308
MAERSDGLAPVTYLPGVQPPSERPTLSSGASSQDRAAAVPARLALGDEPDAEIAATVDTTRAHNVSLHALTRRGMSRREIERTLRSRDLDEETITAEVERLEASGLIDDMALAQNLVGVLQERKGYGRQAVAAELTRRLLSPAAIEYALELIDTSDELARAREIAIKRAGQLSSYDHATAVRRLSGFLMRRGYSGSTLRAAVEAALPSGAASRVTFR